MAVMMNQTDVAALCGVTSRRIRTLESEGWFSRDEHGKYDADEVKQVFAGMNPSNRLAGNLNNGKGYTMEANASAAAVADDGVPRDPWGKPRAIIQGGQLYVPVPDWVTEGSIAYTDDRDTSLTFITDTARAAGNLNAGERVDAAEAMILNALGGWQPLGVHDGWGGDVAKIIAVARQSFDLLRGIEPTELTSPPFNGFPDGIAWERARSYYQIELSNAVQAGDIDSALTLVGTWVARNMMSDLAGQHQYDQNDDYVPHVIPEIAAKATEVIAATMA